MRTRRPSACIAIITHATSCWSFTTARCRRADTDDSSDVASTFASVLQRTGRRASCRSPETTARSATETGSGGGHSRADRACSKRSPDRRSVPGAAERRGSTSTASARSSSNATSDLHGEQTSSGSLLSSGANAFGISPTACATANAEEAGSKSCSSPAIVLGAGADGRAASASARACAVMALEPGL